jgi:DNA primase catalytic core
MTATRDFIDEVKRRTDVVEVIGADVALKPCGKVLKGLSPFHAEKDPSFVVWPGTQSWHDFSNGGSRGGDVIAYLMEARGLAFKEALHELAERAGLRHPEQNDEEYANELARIAERRELETRLTQAAVYYHRKLPTKIRERYYEQHYGFTSETIAALQLGWADGHLYDYFREHLGLSRVAALKTGLFVQRPTGGVENFFHDRLVFPYWKQGKVVYFIARKTEYTGDEEWEQAKYKKLLTHSDKHPYVSPLVGNDHFYNEDAARGAEELVIVGAHEKAQKSGPAAGS